NLRAPVAMFGGAVRFAGELQSQYVVTVTVGQRVGYLLAAARVKGHRAGRDLVIAHQAQRETADFSRLPGAHGDDLAHAVHGQGLMASGRLGGQIGETRGPPAARSATTVPFGHGSAAPTCATG